MNWPALIKAAPLAMKVVREIVDGFSRGASNEEIRKRIASKHVILDSELNELREAKDDLEDFIAGG